MIAKCPVSPRIEKLRNMYYDGPVFRENLTYFHIRRQHLTYMRAYISDTTYKSTLLRKAYAEAEILRQMRPVIDEDELIVGKSDFSPLTPEEQKEFDYLSEQMKGASRHRGIGGHMVLDYPKLLRLGVEGLLEEVRQYRSRLDIDANPMEDLAKDEFYEACETELTALLVLQTHYAEYARTLAEKEENAQRKKELFEIANILDWVPARPARTFKEALQCIHFYHFCLWDGFHYGRVDQYLLPYYRADIQKGILTREEAQEWIDCFRLIALGYIHPDTSVNVMVGGRDTQGNPVENELTEMFLVSLEHNLTMHKVEFAVGRHTSDELLKYAIELNAKGLTLPSLLNDDVITEGLLMAGFAKEDAYNWADTGCVEITPIGKSGIFVVSPYHNMPQMLLDAIQEDCDSFAELFANFQRILRKAVAEKLRDQNKYQLERSRNGKEVMRVSCLVDDCLKRGRSVDQGGAVYNQIQPNFLGLANVADSLLVLDTLIFKTGEYSLQEFRHVLECDFEGYEELRHRIVHRLPHYGTNDAKADAYVAMVTDAIQEACRGLKTFRGDELLPGVFSYVEHANHGLQTGATPDGRKGGYPLASGSSPVQGAETDGPTSAMLSATSWDHRPFLGGVAVNMKFLPSQMAGDRLDKMLAMLKVFLKRGGFQLQINAVSGETLKKAKADPAKYRDLIVRVGGFSANFVKLSPEMQMEIIDRNEHEMGL